MLSSSFRDWVSARKTIWRQRWKVYELQEDVDDFEDDSPANIPRDFWSSQGFSCFEDWRRCRTSEWRRHYSWNQRKRQRIDEEAGESVRLPASGDDEQKLADWMRVRKIQWKLLRSKYQQNLYTYKTWRDTNDSEVTIPPKLSKFQSLDGTEPRPILHWNPLLQRSEQRWRAYKWNEFLVEIDDDDSTTRSIPHDFWSSQGFSTFQDWQSFRTTEWRRHYSWNKQKRKRIEEDAEEIVWLPASGDDEQRLADWLRVRKNQWKILRRKHQRKLEQTLKDTTALAETTTSELCKFKSRDDIELRPLSMSPSARRQTSGDMLLIDSLLEEQERKRTKNRMTFDFRFLFDASLGAPDDVIALCLRFLPVSEHGKLLCISSTTSKAIKQRDEMWRQLCPSHWILPRRPRKRWHDLYLSRIRQAADASRKLSDDLLALIANVLFKGDHIQKIEKLVANGEKKFSFDVNYVSGVVCERNSILNLAVINGRHKVARWLIETKGADIESSDRGGFTPLLNAAWAGSIKLVRFLMSKGADRTKIGRGHYTKPLAAPDFKGYTAEGWAREKDYLEVAELLRVGL